MAATVITAIAKWAIGVMGTVVVTGLLDKYYQKNKDKIGKGFKEWLGEIDKKFLEDYEKNGPKIELINQPTNEATKIGTEKEQTNGIQGSMDYSEFNKWLESAEGKTWLEQAEKIRLENEAKEETKPNDFEFTEDETIGEMLPNPGEEKYDEEKTPIDTPTQPGQEIVDKTDENLGTNNIGSINWLEWAEQQQAKQWAREDEKQLHIEEREDNAWQRSVADMRKAGINPNLINAQPAQSGGGITQATGQNLSGLTSQMSIDAEKLQQLIDQNFKGNEADKERFMEILTSILSVAGMIVAFKK